MFMPKMTIGFLGWRVSIYGSWLTFIYAVWLVTNAAASLDIVRTYDMYWMYWLVMLSLA